MNPDSSYDCIVVGGGMAGLTAASFLVKDGKKVLILEKQNQVGGLVTSFVKNGIHYDGGIRSMENSGIVFPMLKQLGVSIDFVKSKVSIGLEKEVIFVNDAKSIEEYKALLIRNFPESEADIDLIIQEIYKIMSLMDILYGIDNPIFMDLKQNRKYIFKTLLPWLFKFLFSYRKVLKLNIPVEEYLKKLTANQALRDNIGQHFFRQTPAFFAMSYFSLYMDYHYPVGGTQKVPLALRTYIEERGGVIQTSQLVNELHPEEKWIKTDQNIQYFYSSLIWAADLKHLYESVAVDKLDDQQLRQRILNRREELRPLEGGDSVYTVYLGASLPTSFFSERCTGHFFYTPSGKGLSSVNDHLIDDLFKPDFSGDEAVLKRQVFDYLKQFCTYNTYEISIPALRDSTLAPEGKTGLVVSLLFDYRLTQRMDEMGWMAEVKEFMENEFIQVLNDSIFPGLKENIADCFSSTPLTMQRLTGNTGGAITGWAFTNAHMPVVNQLQKVNSSVKTILPDVYQAGQWSYSPSGFPISILTGKLAADRAIKF